MRRNVPAPASYLSRNPAAESRPIHQRLKKLLDQLATRRAILPKSLLGKAISYALNQWPNLRTYLADGRVEIDNNLIENAIRPTKPGPNYANLMIMQRCLRGIRQKPVNVSQQLCIIIGSNEAAFVRRTTLIGTGFHTETRNEAVRTTVVSSSQLELLNEIMQRSVDAIQACR